MVVESVDGTRALLGRSHKIRQAMMTALAGFVDQCESIEEVRSPPSRLCVGPQQGITGNHSF